jgi:molybdopterin synthase catalytic subunit
MRVPVRAGATLGDLVDRILDAHPTLRRHRDSMLLAVNEEFAEPAVPLEEGDEVALMPPVSGGGSGHCRIQENRIDSEDLLDLVRRPSAGAIVLFLGTVRADPGVEALEYEAYESMAVKKFEQVRSAAKETREVTEMAIVHRTGRLPVGETSVAIACSSPHRQAAFDACAWAMEEVKKIVPIWKTERDS